MRNVTICLVYFRSLTLANLEAALYSLKRQDFSSVNSVVVLDNNTDDDARTLIQTIDAREFHVPVCFSSFKHGDPTRTHAWSTNTAVLRTHTSWVFFTRADYLLEVGAVEQFVQVARSKPEDWKGCVTSYGYHLVGDITAIEQSGWRNMDRFPTLPGSMIDYTSIDSGVWMMPRSVFNMVGGLDERLTAWGHAQTHFQYKLHKAGVEFVCIPKLLFYHPVHAGERNLDAANQQLTEIGVDLREMWARHQGAKVY